MSDFITFNTKGVTKKVAVDYLVFKERDCTQTGTTYHIMEKKSVWSEPEDAYPVTQIDKDEFSKLRKKYPDAPLVRISTD